MNLLDMITQSGNGAVVNQMAQQLGLSQSDTSRAVGHLLPALARGIQKNAASPGGLESLLGALKSGDHQRYVDHPEELAQPSTIADGNAILGHILGSKDASRNVAAHAAQQSGVSSDLLKKMLPMLAAAAMGSLGKQTSGGGALGSLFGSSRGKEGSGSPATDLLSSFLDADKDGSVVDDVIGLAKKLF